MKRKIQKLDRNTEIVLGRSFGDVGMAGRNEIRLQGFACRCTGEIVIKVDNRNLKQVTAK
jgi:hypothetical protein